MRTNMSTNYVVLFDDDGVRNIGQQMREHQERLREDLTERQMRDLAYVEGALMFGTVEDAEREFVALDAATQQTSQGISLSRRIYKARDDSAWWDRAHAAMRACIGGKTKMSRSGKTIIFAIPQCGRHDLASWREFAESQFAAAGIQV